MRQFVYKNVEHVLLQLFVGALLSGFSFEHLH